MGNKIDEAILIDYLYGELPDDERRKVEIHLKENRKEAEKMKGFDAIRAALEKLGDKEMIAPSFIFGRTQKTIRFFASQPFRWVGSIAASLIFILIAAYATQFNIVNAERGLLIGFGSLKGENPEISKQNVQAWMTEVMDKYDHKTHLKIDEVESQLTAKIEDQDSENKQAMYAMMNHSAAQTDALMKKYVAQLNDDNKSIIQNFFTLSNEKQKEYTQSVLADFNEFYQNQRNYDLQMIETSMNLMKTNYDVKQIEQGQLLASLYDFVKTKSK